MPLTDASLKNIKPTDKVQQFADGAGLALYVMPNGSKLWRLRYRFNGVAKMLSLGKYPIVSLKDARIKRDNAKALLDKDIDPSFERKTTKLSESIKVSGSFELVARDWYNERKQNLTDKHAEKIIRRLEKDIFPWIGKRLISDITTPELLTVLQQIKGRGAHHTARRALGDCKATFTHGIITGKCTTNPAIALTGALSVPEVEHFASFTEPKDVLKLLESFNHYKGSLQVQCALKFMVLVFVRPIELRTAKWCDIDLEAGEWRFFVTKTKTEHLVPLSRQAIKILRTIEPLTGTGDYVFGITQNKPMSDGTVNKALRQLGWDTKTEFTGHGVRAMARTMLAERLNTTPEHIEHQLAHKVPDALGTAYNRTKYLKQRKEMMQVWADYLDKLKQGAEIIPMFG